MRRIVLGLALACGLSACGLFGSGKPTRVPSGLVSLSPQIDARVVWQSNVGTSGRYALAPAAVQSTVIVASYDGTVTALDAATGQVRWRVQTAFKISAGVAADADIAVVGGPDGQAAALSLKDGSVRWKVSLPAELLGVPAIAGGIAVLRASDARLFGVDAVTGERKWVLQRPLPSLVLRSDAGLAVADDVVYASFPGGRLLSVNAKSGAVITDSAIATPKGTTELERIADVVGAPAVSESQVCATAYQGRIACINAANGSTVWARSLSASVGPAIDSRFVFAVDEASVVQSFARGTGAVIWTVDKFKYRNLSAPVSWDRVVAAGDYQGYVHLLSREDGTYLARIATDGAAVHAAPVIVQASGNSMIVVQTSAGGVYAIAASR